MNVGTLEASIDRGDWRRALEEALDGWRATRAPTLADLVGALGARLATPAPAPSPGLTYQEAWLVAVMADPIGNLGPALATITRSLPFGATTPARSQADLRHKYAPWFARIAALGTVDDPRIAAAYVGLLETVPFLDTFQGAATAYDPLLSEIVRIGDVRQVAALRELAAHPTARRAWLRDLQRHALPPVAAALERQRVVALDEGERQRIVALVTRLAPPPPESPNDDDLLGLVHADLDDDSPREVLADRWLERGDPRGQLVVLQLKDARGAASDEDRAQIASLLRRHEKAWLGPLARVTKHRRWRRGFLDAIELGANAVASQETWIAAATVPALATVRIVRKGNSNETHLRRTVSAARNLREVTAVSKAMLAELCATPPPRLERLGVEFLLDKKAFDAIVAAFPGLTTLWVPLSAATIDTQLARVPTFRKRAPALRIVGREADHRVDGEVLARWLRAAPAELALDDGASIGSSAGGTGLRLRLCLTSLWVLNRILPYLGALEHVALSAPPGAAIVARTSEPYDALAGTRASITLDDAWASVLRAARSR